MRTIGLRKHSQSRVRWLVLGALAAMLILAVTLSPLAAAAAVRISLE